jgi:acyl-CoA synthetase (AMP-forming)/AMP-acid ligase II
LLLQHSSGTTGLQKGVMLSHGAVMRHAEAYLPALGAAPGDVVASWLPLYHDMGLIACFVSPLIAGIPVVWLSPFEWVASPALLVRAISDHRATLTWLPNFAYSFIAQRSRETEGSLDLSCLRAVINCSEPVSAEAMDTFAGRFAPAGLRKEALHTCYAMAENVFAVSASTAGQEPRRARICERTWRDHHRAAPPATDAPSLVHVSNGPAVPGCQVEIRDDAGRAQPSGHAGRVLIRSPFLLSGYFRRDDLNRELLGADGFYDTGDVGWMDPDGHVYVTGRAKDLVIVGGRNVYPQDVEQIAAEVEGVHPGRAVCFGVGVKGLGTEGLVVLAESELAESAWPELAARIRAAVPARLDLDLCDVRVLSLGNLRKSTSGKLARAGNREWYLAERFGPLPRYVIKELAS